MAWRSHGSLMSSTTMLATPWRCHAADRIHNEMGNKPVFGLFDFDQAYNEWDGLKGETVCND
ncbi:MAG: hypothetical protein ACKO4X_13795, partial [Alphaproteobacteria bacterium]